MQTITPFLWFEDQAEEAASFYVSLFRHSKNGTKTYYNEDSAKVAGKPVGSVMVAEWTGEYQYTIDQVLENMARNNRVTRHRPARIPLACKCAVTLREP